MRTILCGMLRLWILIVTPLAFGEENGAPSKPLSRLDAPPVYIRNTHDHSKWPQIIRHGIDVGRTYFGNYGPVCVYILGHDDDQLDTDAFHQYLTKEYCQRRGTDDDQIDNCQRKKGAELIEKALSGRGDAYLSLVDYTKPPLAELVFINPHEFHDPYLYTRGIHEYTHVFQRSFPTTPTWMMEGGAEFFACYLGAQNGWADVRGEMTRFMQNVHRVEDPKLGIQHMEDVDKATPEIRKYYRHLAYDAGAWAFAFMVHKSSSRSVRDVPKKFYPLVAKEGWEGALSQYVNMESKQAFYDAFGDFLQLPLEQQLDMLDTLKD